MTGDAVEARNARRRRHPAAIVEDRLSNWLGRLLSRVGWRPAVVPYTGYGATPGIAGCHGDQGWVRVLARVLMTRPNPTGRVTAPVRGWRQFFTAHVGGAEVVVEVGGRTQTVVADRSGVVDAVVPVALPAGRHDVLLRMAGDGAGGPGDSRVRALAIVHGAATTEGLVSDIDDTVMVTYLPRPLLAGWNTLVLRETARRTVPGMAVFYRRLQEPRPSMATFYLSTGAWNAAPVLSRFLHRHGYPLGPLLLTDWGPTNTGFFRSGQEHKNSTLSRLAAELPHLRWILVGDDGQHDPQIYSDFVHAHPGRTSVICIRQLTPAEQVLSSGRLVNPEHTDVGGVPVVEGADGTELAERMAELGILRA